MREIGRKARTQAPPPRIVYAELLDPGNRERRSWLHLLDDEVPPTVTVLRAGSELQWSSLWPRHPQVVVRFEVCPDGGDGTLLIWTLFTDGPEPGPAAVGHLRKRMQELINRDLRLSFGQ